MDHWLELPEKKWELPAWLIWSALVAFGLVGFLFMTSMIFRRRLNSRTVELTALNSELKTHIVERTKAEEAIKKSEEQLRIVVQNMPVMLDALDEENKLVVWNKECEKVTGYTSEEIIGRPEAMSLLYPDKDYLSQIMSEWSERGDFVGWEIDITRKDGSIRTISWSSIGNKYPIPGWKSWAIGVDVTRRNEAEDFLKKSLKEKNVLLQEIHHRVKNNMQVIISLLRLQADRIQEERFREIFKESQNRIYAMAAVHETLHQSDTLTSIDLSEYLTKLAETTYRTYNTNGGKIRLSIKIQHTIIKLEQSYPIGLVVNELLSNCLKYAFPGNRPGEIKIQGTHPDPKTVLLVISDNGVGMPNDFGWRNEDSLGLEIVRTLVEDQLRGAIELDAGNGTRWEITFPVLTENER